MPSPADPCLFVKQEGDTFSFIFIYVDDGGILGSSKMIQDTLWKLSKSFSIKRMGALNSFVGGLLTTDANKTQTWVTQPKLLGHLREKFAQEVPGRKVKIPASAGFVVTQPKEEDPILDENTQSKYRTGVGMLLYLVKLS